MRPEHKQRPKLEALARRALIERRRALVSTRENAENEARVLYEEREADWEDRAANLTAAAELDRLGDKERAELQRVAAALERIDNGTWGYCLSCGVPIPEGRLEVVPEATRCALCTDHAET